jgi:hypothetical protein
LTARGESVRRVLFRFHAGVFARIATAKRIWFILKQLSRTETLARKLLREARVFHSGKSLTL